MAMPASADIFAANRARGRIGLTVADMGGETRRARVDEAGSLRVRFPGPKARALDAVIVNTAGGIAGGDRFDLDVAVGAGARLTVTTAAAEKVYRSLGPDSTIDVRLSIAAGGTLVWLPQETILFDCARLARTIDVDLADGARLVLAEALVFGRAAMREVVNQGGVRDRWRVRVDGTLRFAETVRLDGGIAQRLGERAVAAGGGAIATVLLLPADQTMVEAVRARADDFRGEVGASAWNGLALMRLVAENGMALRHDLAAVLAALDVPLPRSWLN